MTEQQIIKALKAGDVIKARAKNGDCIPRFHRKPDAYRCAIGKKSIAGKVVCELLKRRIVVPVHQGWYSEGHFRLNTDLRDKRGRFRPRAEGA